MTGFFFDPLPRRHYRVVMIDPPWKWSGGTKNRPQHYQRMTLDEVKALPVRDLLHPDGGRVFLWLTGPLLIRSAEISKAWRLRYSTVIAWSKVWPKDAGSLWLYRDSLARGNGLEAVGNTEYLLILKSGRPQSLNRKPFPNPVITVRRQHSRKPDEIYADIEERLEGPRVDVFSRERRPGWDNWGNEARKFNEPAEAAA
ncbi:MT-A70 family methyltransferase [Phreatobacter oligotrophus]|uniref:N6-adenosine-specific RNA methylase IME4 n=1 Tax=Phreatobacter oligotrophus TaxID=1122261 RepID=A0A2T4ZIS8_9HYPH|nr:MT-A70 family methyltransferase [Phreatobacter oligotrophus]PTM61883.1 N6-adenosine-specific RNA methylase IME4 [Phreatobacter oligotrophus]